MDKRYPGAPNARARPLVDQPHSRLDQRIQGLLNILDAVCDVVQARTSAGQKLPHRGVCPERLEELHVGITHVEQGRLDALLGDGLAVNQRHL